MKVARLPRSGESLDAAAFLSEPGGKGFNLAVASHRLGARVSGVFAIGDDPFSEIAVATFGQVGFPPSMLVRRPGSTGAGVGFVDAGGENCLAVSLGANLRLSADDVESRFDDLDGCHLVMATFESPDAPIRAAFARARSRGIATLLNPSPSRPIDPRILADTSILVVNDVEAEDLGLRGGPDAERSIAASWTTEAIEAVSRAGPETIVVTQGERGAVAFRRGQEPDHQPAFRVPVVDTIGAGDAFTAGLAVALLESRPFAQALVRATANAGLATSRFGAFDAFPTAEDLDRFLASNAGPCGAQPPARSDSSN